MPYYDDDGNEVEGLLPPDEAKALQEKVTTLEEKAARAETLEQELKTKEETLKTYESKEFNFSQLRGKTQQEKEELLKEFSEKEKKLIFEVESLKDEISENKRQTIESYEKDVLEALAGEDEDLKTKIKEMSKEFAGEIKGKEDVLLRYKRAFALIKEDTQSINPINQFQPSMVDPIPKPKKNDYTKTPQGEANLKNWFPKIFNK